MWAKFVYFYVPKGFINYRMKEIMGKSTKMLGITETIGAYRLHLEETDSTNVQAEELLSKTNPSHGTVISASFQHQGKGQFGRMWYSDKEKNVLCSVILRPEHLHASDQFYLNAAVCQALVALINEITSGIVSAKIKWPNDIYVNEKKIAGILIQNTISGYQVKTCIVGIGINVNQEGFTESTVNATSLKSILGKEIDIETVYSQLFLKLEEHYKRLDQKKYSQIKIEYDSGLMDLEKTTKYTNNNRGEVFEGQVLGTTPQGKLILKTDQGSQEYSFGEISRVFETE